MQPTPSLCFSCFHSTRLVCPHCRNPRKVIKGSVISEGYVRKCPKYVPDSLSCSQISKIVNVSRSSLSNYPWYSIDQKLRAKGWLIVPIPIDEDRPDGKKCYAVKKFPKVVTI